MDKIGHWLNEFLMYTGKSGKSFAESIGLSRSDRIYNILNGRNNLSPALARMIKTTYPEVSMEWLLTGKGEMLVEGKIESYKEPEYPMPETKGNIYHTRLIPLFANGGTLSMINESVMDYQCEEVVSPVRDVDFAILVSGDSMHPEYPNGSRVFIKKINLDSFIDWGKVYVIDTCNGIIIKEVRKSIKEGYIDCYSLNPSPKYAPIEVPINDIYGMYRVLACLIPK